MNAVLLNFVHQRFLKNKCISFHRSYGTLIINQHIMMISKDHVKLKTGGIISIFQTSCIQFGPNVVHYLNRFDFKSHFSFEDFISQSVCVVCVCVCAAEDKAPQRWRSYLAQMSVNTMKTLNICIGRPVLISSSTGQQQVCGVCVPTLCVCVCVCVY